MIVFATGGRHLRWALVHVAIPCGLAALWLVALLSAASATDVASSVVTCDGRVATIVGTTGHDVINGTPGNDVIHGRGGNDLIRSGGGHDVICGGGGSDTIAGGPGRDKIFGGAGNDLVRGGAGADSLYGGSGRDELRGGDGADLLSGGPGADLLYGGSGKDLLSGGVGVDVLYGGPRADVLSGNAGRDRLVGGTGNDVLRGGDGADALIGGPGNDEMSGGAGGDTLYGGTGNDLIRGGSGHDELRGEAGRDVLFGETGNDLLVGGPGVDSCNGGLGRNKADSSCETAVNVDLAIPGPDFPVGPTNWDILVDVPTMKAFSSGTHVVTNVRYLAGVIVTGTNTRVTLRNCHVINPGSFWTVLVEGGAHLTMEDCQIGDETSRPGERGVGVNNVTLRRVKIVGHEDGIKAGSNSLYEQVWIDDLRSFKPDPHVDGIQDDGGHSNWVLRYSRVEPERIVGNYEATSAVLIKSDLGSISNVVLEHNIFDHGAYTVYSVKGNNYPTPSNIVIRDNGFGRSYGWGVFSESGTGVVWQGNYRTDTGACISKVGAVISGNCGP